MVDARENQGSSQRPTRVDIDLGALGRNYQAIRRFVGPRRIWCVLKADAYGHGAVQVGRRLQMEGADAFAVATVEEGVQLRTAGVTGRILVLTGIDPLRGIDVEPAAVDAVRNNLDVAVWARPAADALARVARDAGASPARIHLKVDTGMGRLGVLVDESTAVALNLARWIDRLDGAELVGVFANLAAAGVVDASAKQHTNLQIERFGRLCDDLAAGGSCPQHRHLANSAALLAHADAWNASWCTGVRPGLALYGAVSSASPDAVALQPVMSWHSAVAAVRELPAGWPLGYGGRRATQRPCTLAVVPVGYHDGFSRALSDRAEVLVGERRAQVVGAISMDLTLVDITGMPEVVAGTPVTLLGASTGPGEETIGADDLARWGDSIAHEVLCRVGSRVPRRALEPPS